MHVTVVAIFAALVTLAVITGWLLGPRRRALEVAFGGLAVLAWIAATIWRQFPPQFHRDWSYPLHVCDLVALVAGLSLVLPGRLARVITYYFGFALCTQAFATPVLRHGPATLEFWIFWLDHALICGVGLYELLVRSFRPTWHDFRAAVLTGLAYLAVVIPINEAFDLNYGFVGRERARGTLLAVLGPWPERVGVIMLGAALAFALLTLPWTLTRRAPSSATPPEGPGSAS